MLIRAVRQLLRRPVAPEPRPTAGGTAAPSRRRALGAGAGLGLIGIGGLGIGGLAGCSGPHPAGRPPKPADPDAPSVARAIADTQALLAGARTLSVSSSGLAPLLRRMVAVHEAHLNALGVEPTSSPSPTGSPSPSPTGSSASRIETPRALADAEWAAARTALRDALVAAAPIAVLLTRIAAARAADVDLLEQSLRRPQHGAPPPSAVLLPAPAPSSALATPGATLITAAPSPSPAPSPTSAHGRGQIALQRLLAGEHAAVFGYPLAIARVSPFRRPLALTLWQAHRQQRDRLEALLVAQGVQPVASAPAYQVGTPEPTNAWAVGLASRIERGLAALSTDLLAASLPGPDRRLGADQLVLAARRTAAWTGLPAAFPGA